MNDLAGVYEIVNTATDRRYIGSTRDSFRVRWANHWSNLMQGKHYNIRLQEDWTARGPAVFRFDVLLAVDVVSEAELKRLEQQYIDAAGVLFELYNSMPAFVEGADPILFGEFVSMNEAAKILGISYVTLLKLVKKQTLIAAQVAQLGRQRRRFFRRSEVEAVKRQREGKVENV